VDEAARVPTFEVRPASLPPLADALLDLDDVLAEPVSPAPVAGPLQDAIDALAGRWTAELRETADEARRQAHSVAAAADRYARLEALLVPRALR
jgi:hypothetical protein